MNESLPKQVWLLNHYAQEPGHAGGTRHFGIARHLREQGFRVSIIAASVELNTGRQRLSGNRKLKLESYDNVPFLWIRTPPYKGSGLGRLRNMLTYTFRVLLPAYTRDLESPDIIVGSSVHPFAAWAGLILARRYAVPFVFEVRDLWPQTLIDLGRVKDTGVIAWLLRKLEKHLYKNASRIVVLMPNASEYIVPIGIDPSKIFWIPNGVEIEGNLPTPLAENHDQFTFMYFGAHGTANGLDTLLLAMHDIETRTQVSNLRLRLIGGGPRKNSLVAMAESLNLSYVSFEEPIPKEEIPNVAAQADAFIFNLLDSPIYRYGVSPNKIFDFLAAGRPIIFCGRAVNNPVEEAAAGVTVKPGNPGLLADAMIDMAKRPLPERAEMGLAGRQFVKQNHDYRVLAERFSHVLGDA